MDKLKPCPFCGKNDLVLHHDISVPSETHGMYSVYCNSCDASTKYFDDPMEACMAWNRRSEETPPQTEEAVECVMCGETFTEADLTELREMGEAYHREKGCFLCPDCWDSFQRMDPEEQVKMALVNGWKEVNRETDL